MSKIKELIVDINSFDEKKNIEVILDNPFPEEIECTSPVNISINLYKEKDSIFVNGSVKTTMESSCARCLKAVDLDIDGTVEAIYMTEERIKKEKEESPEDLENILPITGELLDLSDRVIEAIIIEIPLKVVCSQDCRGLCSVCGTDLNENPDHVCVSKDVVEVESKWQNALTDLKKKIDN